MGNREDTKGKQEDGDVGAGARGDVDDTMQRLDAHHLRAIPQDTAGGIPEEAGFQTPNTQSKGITTGTCVSVVDGISRCGTPVKRVHTSAAGQDM